MKYKIVFGIRFCNEIFYHNIKKKKYKTLNSAIQAFNDIKKGKYNYLEFIRIEHYYGRM